MNRNRHSISEFIVRRKRLIVIIWAFLLLASVPAIMVYSNYLSYSVNSSSVHSQSQTVNEILSSSGTAAVNSTLFVVVGENASTFSSFYKTENFTSSVYASGISYLASVETPYSAYSSYLTGISHALGPTVNSTFSAMQSAASQIYTFPLKFYENWGALNYSYSSINTAASESGYNGTAYQQHVITFVRSYFSNYSAFVLVGNAIHDSIPILNSTSADAFMSLGPSVNFTHYWLYVNEATSTFLADYYGIHVSPEFVNATVSGENPGKYFVSHYLLEDMPSAIASRFIAPGGKTFLVYIVFSVQEGFAGKNDFVPSQAASPVLISLVKQYFGGTGYLTGNGAISYQIQQVTSKAGFVFGVLFLILGLAVGLTLYTWKAGLLSILFVGIATALGYVSIFLTGILLKQVNYIVNYTLTAVAVGITTDYFVFISSTFREELIDGQPSSNAMRSTASRAGRVVIISGSTVAASLFTFYFIPGYESWGVVLAVAVMLIVVMITTLLPDILLLIGPRIFSKKTLSSSVPSSRRSFFYRAAYTSARKKYLVAGIVLLLAAPSVYLFLTLPTTYNFDAGLPQGLESVRGLNVLEQQFGSNLLYPIVVLYHLNANSTHLNSMQNSTLLSFTRFLFTINGVESVYGPFSSGTQVNTTSGAIQYLIVNGTYALYTVYTTYGPYSSAAAHVVKEIRAYKGTLVGGLAASVVDQSSLNGRLFSTLEVLIAAVIGIIVFIAFRKLRYPLISLSGVFISICWSTSLVYLISVYILHYALIYLIPVILFIILMSLGSDYTVFIFSRVREALQREESIESLAGSFRSTGRVVTGLGLILAVSLGSLAFIPDGFLEELGLAFVISLLVDTFIVRLFYFPSMISIFGKLSVNGVEAPEEVGKRKWR
ncbi:MAG: MMPL family transporter [Methanomassiliicoccales archaeon]